MNGEGDDGHNTLHRYSLSNVTSFIIVSQEHVCLLLCLKFTNTFLLRVLADCSSQLCANMEVAAALKAVRKGTNEVTERMRLLDELVADYGRGPIGRNGVSLLQLKTATLLRYTSNLARFAAGRVQGSAPPAALRESLATDWATLEKARPLERRLRAQLDALAAGAREEAPTHRPNAAAMVGASDSENSDSDGRGDNRTGEAEAYVPPRFAGAVQDGSAGAEARRAAREERRRERMRRGAGARAMLAELSGRPAEFRDADSGVREDADMRAKAKFEEDNFVRLVKTRKERSAAERLHKAAKGEAVRGADDLSGLINFADRVVKKRPAESKMNGAEEDPDAEMEHKVRALDQASGGDRGGRKRRRRGGAQTSRRGGKR